MKKLIVLSIAMAGFCIAASAQKEEDQTIRSTEVPVAVKKSAQAKYVQVHHFRWEKENGDFEANWKANRIDHSTLFTPAGIFVSSETDISPKALPADAIAYIHDHYSSAKVHEASLDKDASGNITYEANIHHFNLIFDQQGKFIKKTDDD